MELFQCILANSTVKAQESPAQDQTSAKSKVKNVLDDSPFPSPRGAALSGAMATTADDLDAAYYNPAGIGGLNWEKQKVPIVRKLYFPEVGASTNKDSVNVSNEFRSAGGTGDRTIGKSVLAANEGKRQYARANVTSGVVLGRVILVPINDLQVAATSRDDGLIDGHYRSLSGFGGGFSAQSPNGHLSLGYFGYSLTRKDVEGAFNYDDMLDTTKRSDAVKAATTDYTGSGHNAGIIWRLGKTWAPTLGIAVKNIGGTTYKAKTEGASNIKLNQDSSIGFSLGPSIGKTGALTLTLQADRLNDNNVSFEKKYRSGLELSLGGLGSYATFSLRAGASSAGGSGGLALNLGLIGFDATVQSVDIGAGNQKVIEQRAVFDFYVNVAEF